MVHYARDGATDAENCITLCWFHHRLVHEGGWNAQGNGDAIVEFVSPTGRRCSDATPCAATARPLRSSPAIDEHTITTALGERMRLVDGVDAMFAWLDPEPN